MVDCECGVRANSLIGLWTRLQYTKMKAWIVAGVKLSALCINQIGRIERGISQLELADCDDGDDLWSLFCGR